MVRPGTSSSACAKITSTPGMTFTLIAWAFAAALVPLWSSERPPDDPATQDAAREDALMRARVWIQPSVPIERIRFDENPEGPFRPTDAVTCTFVPERLGGTTPKFDCRLADGGVVRVKYGRDNPETYGEIAATRLMSALGFPTDHMYVVRSLDCVGCPGDPAAAFACLDNGGARDACLGSRQRTTHFDHVIIERPRRGHRIKGLKIEGWKWRELSKIAPARGGASRAEIDALRLLAIFLGHWDNKPENQRLVCLDEGEAGARCASPLAMVHDLGGTFGPFKVELRGWAAAPVWADAATCTVSMRTLPYGGSSFDDVVISEEGRAFLSARLARISVDQIRQLFDGARFTQAPHDDPAAAAVDNWVNAFVAKRRAIVDRPPCRPPVV
jgi:hypothetical protein